MTTIPDNVASLYGTYTTDAFRFADTDAQAGATLGATYVSETGGIFPDDIVLPSYTLANGAAFLSWVTSPSLRMSTIFSTNATSRHRLRFTRKWL